MSKSARIFGQTAWCLGMWMMACMSCHADVVVVVGSNSKVVALTPDQVTEIYLGRLTSVARELRLLPLEQSQKSVKDEFHRLVTGKSPNQLRAHWAKLVFAGQGNPPAEIPTSAALKEMLAKDERLIGYMDSADVDARVRVVLTVATR